MKLSTQTTILSRISTSYFSTQMDVNMILNVFKMQKHLAAKNLKNFMNQKTI